MRFNMKNLRKIIKEEIDDFDWVRDLEVSTPLSELEINKPYRYQIQPQLLENTKYCGIDINNFPFMLNNEGYVKILDSSYVKEDFVFCNDSNEQILAYFVLFSNGDETNKKDAYLWIEDGSILVYED